MGEKQNVEVSLFFAKDEQFEKIEGVKQLPDIEEMIECGELPFKFGKDYVVYGSFGLPKHFRCKSRKRFIKLLMSKGMRRDCAVWNANMIREIGLSYSDAWFKLMIFGGL